MGCFPNGFVCYNNLDAFKENYFTVWCFFCYLQLLIVIDAIRTKPTHLTLLITDGPPRPPSPSPAGYQNKPLNYNPYGEPYYSDGESSLKRRIREPG